MRLEQGVDRRKRGKDMAAKPFGVGVLAVLLGGNVEIDAVLTWHREITHHSDQLRHTACNSRHAEQLATHL